MAQKTVSAESGSTFRTIRNLWPYMWPADRPDLRARVAWATVLLVVAKLTLVVVPYFFKWATDALAGDFKAPPPLPAFMLAPVRTDQNSPHTPANRPPTMTMASDSIAARGEITSRPQAIRLGLRKSLSGIGTMRAPTCAITP